MTELSGFWETESVSPAGHQQASYTEAHWSQAARILAACSGFEGVAPGWAAGQLGASISAPSDVVIAPGIAIVDGKWFESDAPETFTIGAGPRYDRIVLRASWAGQAEEYTVQLTHLEGTSTLPPSLTQTPGTLYDLPLWQFHVDSGANVSGLVDERVWASRGLVYRQGGHADQWASPGTTTYMPGNMLMQAGSITWTGSAATDGTIDVTYPVPFSEILPLNLVTSRRTNVNASASNLDATQFRIAWHTVDGGTQFEVPFNWLAIGPS